jgi:hypothetical protein
MKKLASALAAILIAASMSVTAFADDSTGFVPSIQQQPAPTVDSSTTVTVNGQEVDVDDLDNSGLTLVVTPLSKADDAPNDEITEMLEQAYTDIATDIEFSTGTDEEAFTAAQDDAESRGKTLVASNIFDISVIDDDNALVDVDGIHVRLAVDNADDLVLVMHKADGTWEVVPFTNNGDGTITLVLSSLSPIAFFVETDATVIDDSSNNDSDDTSSSSSDESGTSSDSSADSTASGTSSGTTSGGSTTTSSGSGKVTSPSTGVAEAGGIALVSAVVFAAGAAVCVVKSKKTH